MRISDWSSDVCSSDLEEPDQPQADDVAAREALPEFQERARELLHADQRQVDRQRYRLVRPPRGVRPQVLEAHAVEREQHHAERAEVEQVPEVTRVDQIGNVSRRDITVQSVELSEYREELKKQK